MHHATVSDKLLLSVGKKVELIFLTVKGHIINLGFISIFISLALLQRYLLDRENKRRDEEKARLSANKDLILVDDQRIGDESLDFIYGL